MKKLRPLFFVFAVFVLEVQHGAGQAALFSLDSVQNEWQLNSYLDVLEMEDSSLSLDQIRQPEWGAKFLPYRDFIKKYKGTSTTEKVLLDASKVYWWRVSIQNNLDQPLRDWVLYTGKSSFTEVFQLDGEGRLAAVSRTGWLMPLEQKDYVTGNRQVERVSISLPEGGSATLYGKVRVVSVKAPFLLLRLSPNDFYQGWDFVEKTRLDWAFIGFLLTVILLNFLLFASTGDRVFLWHALFQTGILLYLLEFFNVLPDMPWIRQHPHFLQVFIYSALCLMDVAYLQFIRLYMGMKTAYPVWDNRFRWVVVARVAFAAAFIGYYLATFNSKIADDLTAIFLTGQYIVMVGLLAWLFGKKDRKSFFLMAGTLIFVSGVVLNAVSVIQGTGVQFSFTQIGVLGEVALFAWGLGYRMKTIRQEEVEMLRLKELDEFKSKFYTNITHEFRTPLTVIRGMAGQLKLHFETTNNSRLGEATELIDRNAGTLLQLINRILDLSKLEAGKMTAHYQLGNVVDYLAYLTHSFQSFAANNDVQLRFLTSLEEMEMDYDAEKLQIILSNLLSNAVKFTPPGGRISVLVNKVPPQGVVGEQLSIEVNDSGVGIPPESLKHIFDRFFQSKDQGNPAGGSGIGLTLTKELVELMGGQIAVSSEVGAGSKFTVLLPVARLAKRAEGGRLREVEWPSSVPVAVEPLSLPLVEGDDESPPLCLVIEDNPDVVRYLQTILETEYTVAVAFDGKRGIEKALELVPDVIVSDVMMPEKDGLEVCDFLKNDERTSHIPVILLTAKTTVQDRLEGLRRGADAYLEKPFNQEELFIELKKSVALRNRLIHHFSTLPVPRAVELSDETDLQIEDAFLQKARVAVEAHLSDDDFDIHRLCRALTMSRAQLHRKLKALTGLSATLFIRSIRLAKAKELLVTTDLNISEIAYEVGFKDPNYFTRTYSEEFGHSPSETRK